MEAAIFYLLAALVLIPAILVVTLKNVFHSALWLVLSLGSVAGVYAMLAADFLFGAQLLVYAGGIMVVLLFVILLSGKPSDWAGAQVNDKALGAGIFTIIFVAVIVTTLIRWPLAVKVVAPETTTGRLGELLINKMILPLEVVSLVLVVSLIGAIFFSVKKLS